MRAAIKDSLRLLCIGMVHLWFFNRSYGGETATWTTMYVYPKDLDTQHEALQGKRVKVTIEIEAD